METWTYWAAPPNLTAEAEANASDSDEITATGLLDQASDLADDATVAANDLAAEAQA